MYSGEVTLLSVDPALDTYGGRLALNIRWLEDGSELTPFPQVRTPNPEFVESGLDVFHQFTVDDDASGSHEYVFTVADDPSGVTLFRSPALSALPAVDQNHNGAFEVIRAAAAPTFTDINNRVTSRLPSSEGGTTITAAALAATAPAGGIALTASGTHVVPGPPGAPSITFPFTYTATLTVVPDVEVFTPMRITSASVTNENITFTTPPGTPPAITLTLAMISPAIARLLRVFVEPTLDSVINEAIRSAVGDRLGLTGPWPSNATITLQRWNPRATDIDIAACVGGVIPFLPQRSGSGCAFGPVLVIGALITAIRHGWFA